MNDFDHIRKVYAPLMPFLSQREHWTDPYFVDWVKLFTPIEWAMWGLIRAQRVPFYPQFPVGRYFVDFGNPNKKIAIECDGRDFHDPDRDFQRDLALLEMGWITVRFTGRECLNLDDLPGIEELQFPASCLAKRDWLAWQAEKQAKELREAA